MPAAWPGSHTSSTSPPAGAMGLARRDPRSARAWLVLARALALAGRPRASANALARFDALADRQTGPFLSAVDLAGLEEVLDLPGMRGLRERLPVSL